MTDTNQLPPHTITIRDHPEPHIMQWSDLELAAVKRYAEQYALQARAQVQGEPFGYIHHFAAHDESGALIDTTWEADGCADPLPHPTFPAMWKWAHCTPFYTTPQSAQATQAEAQQPDNASCKSVQKRLEAQQPATVEPVAQWQKRHPVRTGGRWISTDEHDAKWWSERATGWEARALYTRPAPSVPGDDFDLICNAIDKADTITMEGDYMLDSDDCIAVVRVMQVLLSVRAAMLAAK